MSEVNISDISIGPRFRKDFGDIQGLADSIEALGLLQPIGITPDNELVFGHRRLLAHKHLGQDTITVKYVDVDHMLAAEHDENVKRKDFAPSEIYAITEALRPAVEEAARDRKSGRIMEPTGKLPVGSDGRVRDALASKVGVSGKTLDKIKAVVEAARADPVKYGDLQERMDKNGTIDGAYQTLVQTRDRERVTKLEIRAGKFSTLVLDPPWHYDSGPSSRTLTYETMKEPALRKLPVGDWAMDDCHLWCWTTNHHLPLAIDLVKHWGFEYKAVLVWIKPKLGAGSWLRNTTELCLFAVRGSIPITDRTIASHFEAKAGLHSAKPDLFYDIVRSASVGPFGEAFQRTPRDGFENIYKLVDSDER